ncbi:DUF3592 domain-containing protein [Patescibacteria group bacterium]|nr:DUF3592 domain-containing protein [Patescibacteria group bacterium]
MAWHTGRTLQAIFLFEKTQGTITAEEHGNDFNREIGRLQLQPSSSIGVYKHFASFQAPDGATYQAKTKVGSKPSPFRVGDPVTIYFNPKNPADARFGTFVDLWFGPLAIGFFWFIFFILWFGAWVGDPVKRL